MEQLLTADLPSGNMRGNLFDYTSPPNPNSWSIPLTGTTTTANYYAASDTISGQDVIGGAWDMPSQEP